jgi:D-alanyl-D-alanine carboxypeptidase/D-alanyl-D-alanine-endopeptidase (penicillin-binding protein 4)
MNPLRACLLAVTLAAPFVAAAHDDALPEPVVQALARAGVPPDALGAIAVPRTFWARAWQHRADAVMNPGSAIKLVTTTVALDRLGTQYRGRTELLVAAPIEGGVLSGDLVLRGGADPDLDLPALWQLLFELRERGVREIAGDLVLDRTLFRPARIDIGVPPFDDAPEWPYNTIPDALMLEDALLRFALQSDGERVQARALPSLPGVEIDAGALELSDAPCSEWSRGWRTPSASPAGPGQWRIALAGAFPRRCDVQARLQLLDRTMLAERHVRAVWASLGGTFRRPPGSVREDTAPAGSVRIALHEARPWGEVVRAMNKGSDNALTRLLYLQLGAAAEPQAPATLDAARRAVEQWFDAQRIDRRGLVMDNGAGLSRQERITPRMLARVIEAALDSALAPELLASLPQAGVDGTMRRRLQGTRAQGTARLKTGTLKDVTALAGTVRDTRGADWVLVAIVNDEHAAQARPALDALVEWIADGGARWR